MALNQQLYSNGKLLLTGEYVVLDGALALAVPTTFGQSLSSAPISSPVIKWKSLDRDGTIWFEHNFSLLDIENNEATNAVSERLIQIFDAAKQLNPEFLNTNTGFEIESQLDFPSDWGLGSSSTLINNIAQWANVDAYQLLKRTFGGSGYDIACAQHNSAITYQLHGVEKRTISAVNFNPDFKEHLYFVHLNKKQDSRDGIAQYRAVNKQNLTAVISEVNTITQNIIDCNSLEDFNMLINKHEALISNTIQQPTVKKRLFPDFNGSIKSLGAWGGDFILVSAKENPTAYFKTKGFDTVLNYQTMVL